MTSSKIRVFRPPSPFCHLPSLLPDVIFHQHPSPFPKLIFGKIELYSIIEKLRNQDLTMNIIRNKYQSNCCYLNALDIKQIILINE